MSLKYRHVDVFTDRPFSGNGLTVFVLEQELSTELMQEITREMRQFESIFLFPTNQPNTFRARVFTMEEELDFAGHPTLGAASALHEKFLPNEKSAQWKIKFNAKETLVTTSVFDNRYQASMEQGIPEFGEPLSEERIKKFLSVLNLAVTDLDDNFPPEVISLGLPYLIVPVKSGLENAKISVPNFEAMLEEINAKFVYVFDLLKKEGRTWDNDGKVEDAATGSAAGPTGVYLFRYGLAQAGEVITLNQGNFLGRPSKLKVKIEGAKENIQSVEVSGEVVMMSSGEFDKEVFRELPMEYAAEAQKLLGLKLERSVG